MIMPAKHSHLGFSQEYEDAKRNLSDLREEYSAALEEYSHLKNVVGPNLTSAYITILGKRDYQIYAETVEILRLKREISLYQTALNRGEKPDKKAIDAILKKEF